MTKKTGHIPLRACDACKKRKKTCDHKRQLTVDDENATQDPETGKPMYVKNFKPCALCKGKKSRCTHYDTPDNLLSRVDMGANPVDEPVSSALNMLNLSAPSPLPGLRDSALGHRFDDFLSPYDPQPSTSQFQNPSETDRRPSLQVPALQSSPEVNELDFSTSPSRGSDTRAAGEGASTSSGRSKSPPYHEEKRERKTQDDRKDPPGKSRGSQSKSSKKPKVSKSNDKKPDTSRGSGSGGGTKREDRKGDDDNQGGGRRRKEKA